MSGLGSGCQPFLMMVEPIDLQEGNDLDMSRRTVPGKGLAQPLGDPQGRGMGRAPEMHDPEPLLANHHEDEEIRERCRRHGEEVASSRVTIKSHLCPATDWCVEPSRCSITPPIGRRGRSRRCTRRRGAGLILPCA